MKALMPRPHPRGGPLRQLWQVRQITTRCTWLGQPPISAAAHAWWRSATAWPVSMPRPHPRGEPLRQLWQVWQITTGCTWLGQPPISAAASAKAVESIRGDSKSYRNTSKSYRSYRNWAGGPPAARSGPQPGGYLPMTCSPHNL